MNTRTCVFTVTLALALLPVLACGDGDAGDGAASGGASSADTPDPRTDAPELVEGDCPPPVPRAEGFRCGTVTVSMRPGDPTSPPVDLAVAVLPAPEPGRHDDPLVVIDRMEASIAGYDGVAPLPERVGRDVIIFDMRGTGRSTPSLDCTEMDYLSPVAETDPAGRRPYLDEVDACRERLEGDGVDLSAYTAQSIAADVVAIRRALGYERWNILGFGREANDAGMESTPVVLELMRIDGDAIRSVTLDAPTPPQLDPWTTEVENAARAIDAVARACAEQPQCADAHPDLTAELARRLGAPRTEIDAVSGDGDPMTVAFDRSWWGQYLASGIGSQAYLPDMPRLASAPLDELASVIAASTARKSVDSEEVEGFLLSVLCAQTGAATTLEDRSSPNDVGVTPWGTYAQSDSCDRWPAAELDRSSDGPVTADIPALLLVGEFDPHANEAGARLLASTLRRAYVYEIPAATAGVLGTSDCARQIRNAFVVDPTSEPDSSCIGEVAPTRFTG